MKKSIDLSAPACILGAFVLLTVPLKWLLAALLAGTVHECGHALAIYLTGGEITAFRIGAHGACMEISTMSRGKELICTAAGLAASFGLLLAAKHLPRTALCAAVQGFYNLMPIYPLDGGRMLRCVMGMLAGEQRGELVCRRVEISFCWLLAAGVLTAAVVFRLSLFPLLIAAAFAILRKPPLREQKYCGKR